MKVAAYLRVSTGGQRERGSIETQAAAVADWCERNGHSVVAEYRDDGYSGTLDFQQRPGAQQLLRDARQFDAVVVYSLDRLGRDGADLAPVMLGALQALMAKGLQVLSVTSTVDTTTSDGRFKVRIESALSAHEREKLLERTSAGMKRKAKEGGWLGGPVPYGYRAIGNPGDSRLVVCEEDVAPGISEAEIVRRMFAMVASGKSCGEVADYLNALGTNPGMRPRGTSSRGLRARRTAQKWLHSRVNRIVRNPIYKGEHSFRSGSDVIQRTFPAMVDAVTWNRAQAAMKANERIGGAKSATRDNLLRGKMVCEGCGTAYVGQSMMDNRGKRRAYYTKGRGKRAAERFGGCPHKHIRAEEIEAAVWADIAGMLKRPGEVLDSVEQQLGLNVEARAGLQEEIADYRRRVQEKDAERDRIVAAYGRGILDDVELERQLPALRAEREALAGYVADLEARVSDQGAAAGHAHSIKALIAQHRARIESGTPDFATRRATVEALVERINVTTTVRDGKKDQSLQVVYRLAAPEVAAGVGDAVTQALSLDASSPTPTRSSRPRRATPRA